MTTERQGLLASVGAFLMWGLFPLYWKQIDHVPALQIMTHRLVWCFVFVVAYLLLRYGRSWLAPVLAQPRLMALLCTSGTIIGGNWFLYIWAVNNGHIVETSLGYFINPLVNVLLGVLVLRERLNRRQWLAIAIAAAGVGWLTSQVGTLPWIALGLALSFGTYGLIRKVAAVDSVPGLAIESGLLLLPGLAYLLWLGATGHGDFGRHGGLTDSLLIAGGLVTALPLVLFAYGARRIPLATVGILQYLAPSLQLLCGVLVYHEPFTRTDLIGFACIWCALGIYAADGLSRLRRLGRAPTTAATDG